jgi:hypothetical protein
MLVFMAVVIGGCVLVGWVAGLGTLVVGGAREQRRRQESRRHAFIDRFGTTPEAVLLMNATCAGMTVRHWTALPVEERSRIIRSWDLGGQRGGPHLPPELMALRNGH